MSASAIRIQGLSKRFGSILALDDVGFDVPPHSIFGLLGPNGAGKTTLFSIVANFLHADSGSVEVLGVNVRRISALCGRMTILPQDAQFQRNVPIVEQLTFFRMLDGKDRGVAEREVQESLKRVGLEDYARRGVRALSHGMVKRLGIAQAFLGNPEVIILDEPTAGLDPANARQIRDLVRELQDQATILISSHNIGEIQDLCDRVAILDKGKLVTDGEVSELTRSGLELELGLARPLSGEEKARLETLPGVTQVDAGKAPLYTFTLDLEGKTWDEVVASILATCLELGNVPRQLSEGKSLESHFLSVTGNGDDGLGEG